MDRLQQIKIQIDENHSPPTHAISVTSSHPTVIQTTQVTFHRVQTLSKLVESASSLWMHLLAPKKIDTIFECIHEADLEVTEKKKNITSLALCE
jgi:hypothetical protein